MYLTPGLLSSNQRKHHIWGVVWCGGQNLQTKLSRRCGGALHLFRRPSDRSSGWAHPTSPFTRSSFADPFTRSSFARSAGEEAGGCGSRRTAEVSTDTGSAPLGSREYDRQAPPMSIACSCITMSACIFYFGDMKSAPKSLVSRFFYQKLDLLTTINCKSINNRL